MPILQGSHFIYTVRPGDTLYSIAVTLGGAVQLLEQTNALYPPVTDEGLIYPGQVLVVSEAGEDQRSQVAQIVGPGDILAEIADRYDATPELIAGINRQVTDPNVIYVNQTVLVPAFIYEIEEGDTLAAVASRFGLTVADLLRANRRRPGISADVIFPGYRLIIPLPSSSNIVVFRPLPGTVLRPGRTLEGFARLFEGVGQYRIIDGNGQVVTSDRTFRTLVAAPEFGYFSSVIVFDRTPTTATGELWVFGRSPYDGGIRDLVRVRVFFGPL